MFGCSFQKAGLLAVQTTRLLRSRRCALLEMLRPVPCMLCTSACLLHPLSSPPQGTNDLACGTFVCSRGSGIVTVSLDTTYAPSISVLPSALHLSGFRSRSNTTDADSDEFSAKASALSHDMHCGPLPAGVHLIEQAALPRMPMQRPVYIRHMLKTWLCICFDDAVCSNGGHESGSKVFIASRHTLLAVCDICASMHQRGLANQHTVIPFGFPSP